MRKRIGVVLLAVVFSATPSPATAHGPDDLGPNQDNPPGCETATSENPDGCGAQGREHFSNAQHKPPIQACRGQRSRLGSVVTRVLPKGPMRRDGSLAFISGACVYLPPNYSASGLRYPVLYLLHGGGGDQGNWVTMGGLQAVADRAYARDKRNAAIVVMPDGRSGQWYDYRDRRFLNETYVLRFVVPYIDKHFRTIADRRGRSIVGLSNGGYGAMHLAAKRPDMFVAAGSMSGNLGARSMGNLGTEAFPGGPSFQEAGAYYYGNTPAPLASNLDGVDLILDWGASCMSDATVDLCALWVAEQAFRADNQYFRDRLEAVEHKGKVDYREAEGAHKWRWWTEWLHKRHLPFVLKRMVDPTSSVVGSSPVPALFRYRSIFDSSSVWDYDVRVRRSAREFLDLLDVKANGFTVQGSGGVSIVTAPRYAPGKRYAVWGAGGRAKVLRADRRGRLAISVDLGPSHTDDQYSVAGRTAEAQGDYFTVRKVKIAAA